MYDGFEFSFVKSEAGNLSIGVILLVGGINSSHRYGSLSFL